MDKTIRREIITEIENLTTVLNQQDLRDIYSTLHSTTVDYTFFSSEHETFSRSNHILGHKTNLIKFENIEVIQTMLSKNSGIKIEANNRKIFGEFTDMWKLNNTLRITNGSKKLQGKLENTLK